jgi:hypothetical protein
MGVAGESRAGRASSLIVVDQGTHFVGLDAAREFVFGSGVARKQILMRGQGLIVIALVILAHPVKQEIQLFVLRLL